MSAAPLPTVALARYDAACRALAAATKVDEAKRIHDTAEAMRAYAKQAKNRTLEVQAAELRIRAERRIGQLIDSQRKTVGLNRGTAGAGRPKLGGATKAPPNPLPRLADVGIDKKLSTRAQQLAAVPAPKFDAMLADWHGRVERETERVTTNLLREGQRATVAAARPPKALPPGQFRLLYADPPWRYQHLPQTESRRIENQYPTMELAAICALRVPAADDAVLFLWATSPKLAEALEVITAWGFTYTTCAVWDKERMGMGYYFRQQHELLLVATRGALPVPKDSLRMSSVIRVRRGAHSEKPARVYELLEAMYPHFTAADRVELFARRQRPGWTTWSNEPAVAS